MDLIDDPKPGQNVPELTVTELAGGIKRTLEGTFGRVRVKGEIGRLSRPASGHLYFDLKDEKSVIASVAWKGVAARLRTPPEEGMEVVATGKISTFGPQSKYQLIVDDIAPAGLGALMVMLEKRKKALAAEGLFDQDRKKTIPYLPEVIGVVTSPSGAVIRDILHRLRDRFPRQVVLWPVVVQGERCAQEVADAVHGFNAIDPGGTIPRPDVLIVARGGGSLEDLWGFNEELPVRAVAESSIPVISAVGHETDTTLIDFAADVRAPTPTAAAELAVPVRVDLLAAVASFDERRIRAVGQGLSSRRDRLRDLGRMLPRPQAILGERLQSFDALALRLDGALGGLTGKKARELAERTGGFGPRLLAGFLSRQSDRITSEDARLRLGVERRLAARQDQFRRSGRLPTDYLTRQISRFSGALDDRAARLRPSLSNLQGQRSERLNSLGRTLKTLGYRETLERGFAVVRDQEGTLLAGSTEAGKAAGLEIEFRDGRLHLGPASGKVPGPVSGKPKKPPAQKTGPKSDTGQGSLF